MWPGIVIALAKGVGVGLIEFLMFSKVMPRRGIDRVWWVAGVWGGGRFGVG